MNAVVGKRTARALAAIAPLQALPFASPRLVTAMPWHRKQHDAPTHRRLRGLLLRVARMS